MRAWIRSAWILCLVSACATASQRSAMLAKSEGNVEVDEAQMRTVLYDYIFDFTQTVELAADDIARRERDDAKVLREALLWKIGAGMQAKRAAFNLDVLIGFMDAWTLAAQQKQFFTSGAGKGMFGPSQHIAVDAAETLAKRAHGLASEVANQRGVQRGGEIVADWVRKHPIQNITFARESIATKLLMEYYRPKKHGMAQSVANIEQTLDDVLQRLTLYSERSPREVLWASQLTATDLLQHPAVARAMNDLSETQLAATQLMSFVEHIPKLIDVERAAVFKDIDREREATLTALQEERALVLAAVREERLAVMQEIQTMYQGGLSTAQQERAIVLAQLPDTVAKSMAKSDETLRALIDHLLLRFAQLVTAVGILLGVGWLMLAAWRHRGHAPPSGRRSRAPA